jgi:AbrB family looped-hinge helix DNA binding protein
LDRPDLKGFIPGGGEFMERAKITYKGQVAIPKKVRALSIKKGESVLFQVEGDHAILKPIKNSLQNFYGSFPATRSYKGMEAVRKEVLASEGKGLSPLRGVHEKSLYRCQSHLAVYNPRPSGHGGSSP